MAARAIRAGPARRALVIARRGRFQVAMPLLERGEQLPVTRGRVKVRDGRIALCRVDGRGAQPIVDLGRADRARDVVAALLAHRDVRPTFPRRLEEEAVQASSRLREERGGRRDLTAAPTFTVDPKTARDFDDAVSAQRDRDGWRLWIHIADVAAHVPAGGGLDREAADRANSTYAPGTVAPMLPRGLSDDACSLNPGVDRLAVTAEVELGADGRARGTSFYRSLIRSDARLDYEELDRIFAGRERPPELIAEPIAAARAAAAAIAERGGPATLEVKGAEPEFAFDADGNVAGASAVEQTESHRLIERLMILTNEQVANLLERKGTPALYRVHEPPDPARIGQLIDQLDSLDLPTPPLPDDLAPSRAGELAAEASRLVAREAERRGHGGASLSSLVLRSLKQARYSERNLGHAGLGSPAYAHFTSPIRRYPDLIAHRALLSVLGAGEPPPERSEVAAAATHCSERERESMRIERDGDDICLAFLLERELRERGWDAGFEGEVSGVVGAGAFVRFAGEHADVYEGFLPARLVPGERYELNALETALVGTRTGTRIGFGDPVRVGVTGIEAPRGRVDLRPLEGAARPARSGRGRAAESRRGGPAPSSRPKRGRKGAAPRRRGR
jgi:ribonuclease R